MTVDEKRLFNRDCGHRDVRREIGKGQRVKVSNRKGIVNQTGPESCVAFTP